jgi:hypothetical protein
MTKSLRMLSAFAVAALFLSGLAHAQPTLESFGRLERALRVGDTVTITDKAGQKISGRVTEVLPASVTVTMLVRDTLPNGAQLWKTGEQRTFTESNVAIVTVADAEGREGTVVYRASGTFAVLEGNLRVGQTAIVTDAAGGRTRGKVAELWADAVVIIPQRTVTRQRFPPAEVSRIQRVDPIWDGPLKGVGVGFTASLLFVAACGGGSECSPLLLMGTGIGAAIGLGLDVAFGPKTVYVSRASRKGLVLSPLVTKDRRGVLATIRF